MKTSFWTELLDVISPRTCVVCNRRLTAGEQVLCATCHLHIPLTHYEVQPTDNPMARLFWGLIPVERAAALFFYSPKTDVSRIIYDMKYRSMPDVGRAMGELTARRFSKAEPRLETTGNASGFFVGIDAIIPMPISWRRQWQRGYNQSVEIARGISKVTGLPIVNKVVRRQHFRQSQTNLNAMERKQNVEGAFLLTHGERIAHRHVLLVDDIVTTGATVTACAQELAKVPGVKISILTLGITKT